MSSNLPQGVEDDVCSDIVRRAIDYGYRAGFKEGKGIT